MKNIKCSVKKKQTTVAWLVVCFIILNIFGVSISQATINTSIKRIVASWSQGNENIGKIKFVSSEEDEVINVVSLFDLNYTMPFKNGYATKTEEGKLLINGNGDVMVVSCYKCKVQNITTENNKRVVVFDMGFSVKVKYIGLDNIGVEFGNKLKAGDAVGICNASVLEIQVLYKDQLYDKLKIKDGRIAL